MTETLTPLHGLVDGLDSCLSTSVFDSMNFLNEVAHRHPAAISFAAGRPAEAYFDVDDVHRHLQTFTAHLTARYGGDVGLVRRTLLQYGRTKGIIHDLVAENLRLDEHIDVDPEAIVVTVGCQEALFLTLRALRRDDGDALVVILPVYVGVLGAAQVAGLPVITVEAPPAGGAGLAEVVAEAIDRAAAEGRTVRACYVHADFANPSGTSLDLTTRSELLQLAGSRDLLLLEDNAYGLFHGDVHPPPTLKALDRDRRVVYLGSFAKTAMPGARVGYVVADQLVTDRSGGGEPRLLADELAKLKSMVTVNTAPLAQAVIGGKLLANGLSLRAANVRERQVYARNLGQLLAGLERRFAGTPGVRWNRPDGGFHLMLDLPFPAGDEELESCATEHLVLWTPAHYFYGGGPPRPQIRLSFSHLTAGEIEAGLDRLQSFVTTRT